MLIVINVISGVSVVRERLKNNKGKICLMISAFIYGLAPILAKITYSGGTRAITLAFLRASLTVPLLFILLKTNHVSLKLTKKEFKNVTILGTLGGAVPIILLYMSYRYISTGLATTLHFIYPLVIVFASAFIYHEKIRRTTIAASILVTIGIFLFVDINTASDKIGIILAMFSGIFYSFYVLYMDKSGLDSMDYIKLTFYTMLIISVSTLIFGFIAHGISFDMTPKAWMYAFLISLLITLLAMPLFQAGVKYEGASTAGILSTIEPITTIILGAVFLGELVGAAQYIGGVLILAGVTAVQIAK